MLLLLPFGEPGNPALHRTWIEFALPGKRFGLRLVVEPLPFERRQQVIACPLAHFCERLVLLGLAELFQFGVALLSLGLVFVILPGQRGRAEQRFVRRLVATREHAVERVVVFGRDRIVLMVVTT